jgi:sirohydrochlorin ferrochelatase
MSLGVIIVDHGSRSDVSNRLLHELVVRFAQKFAAMYRIVEPAHMELAEPSIAKAYERCVARGADEIIVCPFFLSPGKHMQVDIPKLAREAAAQFPHTRHVVAQPLGVDDLMLLLLDKRAAEAAHRLHVQQEAACAVS